MRAALPICNPTPQRASVGALARPPSRGRSALCRLAAVGLRLCIAALLLPASLSALTTNQTPDKIPPLRPPRGLMQPSFWELHEGKVMAGALAGLLGIGGLIWWRRRPRPVVSEAPEVTARRALEALRGRAEDAGLMTLVARGLCRYVQATLALAPEEWTTEQLLAAVRQGSPAKADLVHALEQLLRECDTRAFAPLPPPAPPGLVERALAFVDRLDQERRLRAQGGSAASPAPGEGPQAARGATAPPPL
jgi:hypothetical protein